MDILTKGNNFPVYRTGFEGEDGDGEEGAAAGDGEKTFTQADVAAMIAKEVGGLKNTNSALKAEKSETAKALKAMQDQFASLGGAEGITKLSEFQKKLGEDESTRLLSEGKHEEWFDKRTSALRKSHESELGSVAQERDEAVSKADKAISKLHQTLLKAETLSAAKDSGTVKEAAADIQLRAERSFTWDEERDALVIKDEDGDTVLSKDGKSPKSVAEWLDEQKESARHWWPASKGAGAGGSGEGGRSGEEDISTADFETFAAKRMAQKEARKKTQGFRA